MSHPAPQVDQHDPNPDDGRHGQDRWKLWLQRNDQLLVVSIFGLSILVIVGSMAYQWWMGSAPVEIDQSQPQQIDYRVDLNDAQWPELTTLPGIGEKLARRIVEFRDAHGPFEDFESLLHVSGIGPKKLEGIRPHLMPLD